LCKEISNYRENLGFLPRLLFFSSPCLSIQIFDDCSTIDLPDEMPSEVLEMLQKTVVCGKRLNMNYRENLGFLPRLLFFSSPCLWFLENFLRPVVRFLWLCVAT
jgi:hypothetical protein